MEANDDARQDPCFVELKRGCSCAFWNFNDGGQVKEESAAEFTQTEHTSLVLKLARFGLGTSRFV